MSTPNPKSLVMLVVSWVGTGFKSPLEWYFSDNTRGVSEHASLGDCVNRYNLPLARHAAYWYGGWVMLTNHFGTNRSSVADFDWISTIINTTLLSLKWSIARVPLLIKAKMQPAVSCKTSNIGYMFLLTRECKDSVLVT